MATYRRAWYTLRRLVSGLRWSHGAGAASSNYLYADDGATLLTTDDGVTFLTQG